MSLGPEPADLAEVEERRRFEYISKKELFIALPVMLILVVIGFYVFEKLKKGTEEAVCTKNMQQIATAIGLYVAENNDSYPSAFEPDANGMPRYEPNGAAITWVTQLSNYMNVRANFRCPSAKPEELTWNVSRFNSTPKEGEYVEPLPQGITGNAVPSSYGFYGQWSLKHLSDAPNPALEIMISETSNMGAEGTIDPHPFELSGAKQRFDGFLIGWDTGNDLLEKSSKYVTRLAFPQSAQKGLIEGGRARHESTIHGLFLDGHVDFIRVSQARIEHLGDQAVGMWGDR